MFLGNGFREIFSEEGVRYVHLCQGNADLISLGGGDLSKGAFQLAHYLHMYGTGWGLTIGESSQPLMTSDKL